MNWKINSDVNGDGISPAPPDHADGSARDRIEQRREVCGRSRSSSRHSRTVSSRIGKSGNCAGDLQQVLGAQPLEPERRSLGRIGARHEQGAGGVLAKPQAEKRRLGQFFADQPLRQVAGQSVEQVERRLVHRRQPKQQPVIAVQAGRRQPDIARECVPVRASLSAWCSRPPNGVSTASPSSPAGSTNVSITIVRSSGTAPASRCWRRI